VLPYILQALTLCQTHSTQTVAFRAEINTRADTKVEVGFKDVDLNVATTTILAAPIEDQSHDALSVRKRVVVRGSTQIRSKQERRRPLRASLTTVLKDVTLRANLNSTRSD
jgi:hypothetical protein